MICVMLKSFLSDTSWQTFLEFLWSMTPTEVIPEVQPDHLQNKSVIWNTIIVHSTVYVNNAAFVRWDEIVRLLVALPHMNKSGTLLSYKNRVYFKNPKHRINTNSRMSTDLSGWRTNIWKLLKMSKRNSSSWVNINVDGVLCSASSHFN